MSLIHFPVSSLFTCQPGKTSAGPLIKACFQGKKAHVCVPKAHTLRDLPGEDILNACISCDMTFRDVLKANISFNMPSGDIPKAGISCDMPSRDILKANNSCGIPDKDMLKPSNTVIFLENCVKPNNSLFCITLKQSRLWEQI